MEIDRKELKRRARADMGAAKPPFWAVLLAYLLLTTGVSDLLYLVPLPGGDGIPTTSIFLSVLITLYLWVMSFGLDLWSLWTTRHLDPGMNALFQGFSGAGHLAEHLHGPSDHLPSLPRRHRPGTVLFSPVPPAAGRAGGTDLLHHPGDVRPVL